MVKSELGQIEQIQKLRHLALPFFVSLMWSERESFGRIQHVCAPLNYIKVECQALNTLSLPVSFSEQSLILTPLHLSLTFQRYLRLLSNISHDCVFSPSAMSIFSSFLVLLLILVEAAPPTASSVPTLGKYISYQSADV